MATTYQEIYDIFDSKVESLDWIDAADEDVAADKRQLLENSLAFFLLPRFDIEDRDEIGFSATLNHMEKNIIATLMKVEWVKSYVASWKHMELQYNTKDWALGNQQAHLNQLLKLQEATTLEAKELQSMYNRIRDHKAFDCSRLAGKGAKR